MRDRRYMTQEEVTDFVKKWRRGSGQATADALFGSDHENKVKQQRKESRARLKKELDAIHFPSYWVIATTPEKIGTIVAVSIFVTGLVLLLGAS